MAGGAHGETTLGPCGVQRRSMNEVMAQGTPPKVAPRISLPLQRSASTPALPVAAVEPTLPSLPRGKRLSVGKLSFHIPKCPETPVTPASSSRAAQGGERLCGERRSFVRFSTEGVVEKDITPYSAIYGEHPRKFFFDSSGEKIPADSSRYDVGRWQVKVPAGAGPLPHSKDCGGDVALPAPPPSPREGLGSTVAEATCLVGLETRLRRLSSLYQHQSTLLRLGASLVVASGSCGNQDQPASAKEILLAALAQAKKTPHVVHHAGAPRSSSAGSLRRPTKVRRPSPPAPLSSCQRAPDGQDDLASCSTEGVAAIACKSQPREACSTCPALN